MQTHEVQLKMRLFLSLRLSEYDYTKVFYSKFLQTTIISFCRDSNVNFGRLKMSELQVCHIARQLYFTLQMWRYRYLQYTQSLFTVQKWKVSLPVTHGSAQRVKSMLRTNLYTRTFSNRVCSKLGLSAAIFDIYHSALQSRLD